MGKSRPRSTSISANQIRKFLGRQSHKITGRIAHKNVYTTFHRDEYPRKRRGPINNGHRIEWNTIRSVIIRGNKKSIELDDTTSSYRLIITITISIPTKVKVTFAKSY